PAPSVGDRFEPVHGRRAGPSARGPGRRLDQLELVGREERLGQRVVPAPARPAHRLLHPVGGAQVPELGRGVLGEFNWSSQHLTTEVLYGKATWVDGDADGAAGDAVAGPTAGAARCGAGVLGEDCRRAVERGGGDRVWGISAGRGTLVPRAGWHAVDPAHPAVGEVSVVR